MRSAAFAVFAAVVASLGACAGTQTTSQHLASTQASISAAAAVGAAREPTGALHLQYAREEYAQADNLSRDGEIEAADRMFLRAQSDAELAGALARRQDARRAVDEARARAEAAQPSTAPAPAAR